MALNRKTREAEERANRIHAEVYGNSEQPPTPPVEQSQQNEPPQPVVTQEEVQQPPLEDWQQKYRVLQGKYSAEVPRMAEEIRELKALIQDLKESKPEPQQAPLDLKGMTPEAVVEQFGEDFASAVGAIAARIAEQQGKSIRDEFAPKVEAVAKTTAETQRAEFMRQLEAAVPDYKQIDVSDEFTAFLDEVDPLSGRSRRHFFNEANSQNNVQRIASFFNSFKATKTVVDPAPAVNQRMSIDNQIAPSTSRANGESPAAKKYWTQGDIRQFYQDVRRGRYTAEQGRLIELDIFAAAQEGRMAA